MTRLYALWVMSLAVCAISLLIMLALIVARVINNRRAASQQSERRRMVPLLLGVQPSSERIPNVQPASDLLTDVAIELVQMVRGTDKEAFVARSYRLGVDATLRHRLRRHRSPRLRLAAAEALADFEDEQSMSHLSEALDDKNSDVRLSAAIALANAGKAPPVSVLVDKLGIGSTENSMLVVSLFRDIAAYRPGEIRALVEDERTHPSVKAAAIDALAASGDYSLVPVVVSLSLKADPFGEELPRYLRSLADFGHPAAAPAIEHALDSPAWTARAAAAQAAGKLRLRSTVERLASLLGDPQWWVRFRAGEALASLGKPGHRLLQQVSRSGSELASTAARLTLAEQGLRQ